ncbi:MAG: DedA family protein [Spirochaetes bacterium]|nr:DedA family protein [Spirochaetota bacterium]
MDTSIIAVFSDIPDYLISMAPYLHFVSFGLLILAGFNLPIPEDIVMIVSGSIAATIVPENTVIIIAGCFLGAYISDIYAYCVGRYFLNWIIRHKRMSKIVPMKKIHTMEQYFAKYGEKTLFFGRFIPFGFRNAIFMTSGILGMKFLHFLIIDFLALCATTSILFTLGYKFGSKYQVVIDFANKFYFILFPILILVIILFVRKFLKHHRENDQE